MKRSYEDKREKIKHVAVNFFARYGYNKTTLEDIASGLGIKKNTLYYYFPNKESLFSEIINDEVDMIFLEIEDELASIVSPLQKIETFIKKMIHVGKDRSKVYAIRLKVFLELGEIIEKKMETISDRAAKKIRNILEECIQKGELKQHNTNELAQNIVLVASSLEFRTLRLVEMDSFSQINYTKLEKNILSILKYMLEGVKA